MRKNLFVGALACAALTMTGCSNNEVIENAAQQSGQAIQFSTYLGKSVQGRGTETNDNTIQSDNFGVLAFYTKQTAWASYGKTQAANFMYNQKVRYADSKWSYKPVKYWPTMKGDKISFFAYAPYDNPTESIDKGVELADNNATENVTSLTFTVKDVASDMIDFVAAQVIDAKQKEEEVGGADSINFKFQHELSRLAFKVKTSDALQEKSHVVLKSAILVAAGYYKSATYTFADVSTDPENVTTRGAWSDKTAMETNYDLASVIDFTTEGATIGNKTYTGQKTFEITGTANDLFTTGQYLFLIPETDKNGVGLAARKAAITFAYDIVTEDNSLDAGYSCTEATKTVYLPGGILKQGVAYNITFTFNVDELEVKGAVTGWSAEEPNSGTVPFTPDNAVIGN